MKRWASSCCVLAALGAAGCGEDSTSPPGATIPVHYEYASADSNGIAMAAGNLEIVYHLARDDDRGAMLATITGSWITEAAGDSSGIWQTGEGALAGGVARDRTIAIDLHPGVSDANTILNGAFDAPLYGSFGGAWFDAGIGGPLNHGTFRAVKT